jgi:hypothetical protein
MVSFVHFAWVGTALVECIEVGGHGLANVCWGEQRPNSFAP